METGNAFLVVCGALLLVLIINVGILISLLRPGMSNQLKVLGKTIEAIRNPWGRADKDMKELHDRISDLGKQPDEDNDDDQ